MDRLNYHHLLYFFTVAREGSVARASARLGLTQPTVSAQIHALEQKLGRKLLERNGRGIKITPAGETVMQYAGSIFALGGDLLTALNGQTDAAPKLAVGVSSSLPQALAATLLQPLLGLNPRPLLTIVEGPPETLAAQLQSQFLQFVLTDAPLANRSSLHSRPLLETPIVLFAPEALARKLRKDFPARLNGAPVLMTSDGPLRREVEHWLAGRNLAVEKLAEMPHPESYAPAVGAAVFSPSLLRDWLRTEHRLLPVGELNGARWSAFVVTARKGVKPLGLDAVIGAAKDLCRC